MRGGIFFDDGGEDVVRTFSVQHDQLRREFYQSQHLHLRHDHLLSLSLSLSARHLC